jgi:hypothetical protein
MAMMILETQDLEQFAIHGWCIVRGAFTARQAEAARAAVWRRMAHKAGILESQPSTWPPAYDIEEQLADPAVLACFTDRLAAAIEQLVGDDRWTGVRRWGFWPVNFYHGSNSADRWPATGWHIDGNWFRHTLHSPQQGLLLAGLFSDVAPGGGGMVVAAGSHRRTARVLAAHPDGVSHTELFDRVLAEPLGGFCEITGQAGDVMLGHPWLFHTRGFKRHGEPRILSNSEVPLREPMVLERAAGDYSVLEQSIRLALSEPPGPPLHDAMPCKF